MVKIKNHQAKLLNNNLKNFNLAIKNVLKAPFTFLFKCQGFVIIWRNKLSRILQKKYMLQI